MAENQNPIANGWKEITSTNLQSTSFIRKLYFKLVTSVSRSALYSSQLISFM